MLTAIGALVVGLSSLFVAADQAKSVREQASVMRAQQAAVVWPVLQVDPFARDEDGTFSVGVTVTNAGVGPAVVRFANVRIDGADQGDWPELRQIIPEDFPGSTWTSNLQGRVIPPGGSVEVFRAGWDITGPSAETRSTRARAIWRGFFDQVALEACYCSVFEDCWRVGGYQGASLPTPTPSCPAPPAAPQG